MVKSIYPSIPMPGADLSTVLPAVEAMRQTINLIILNGLSPNPNYTPSESAQVFVTYAALTNLGIVGPPGPIGPQGPPGTSGVPEAPNDVNLYARHALAWQSLGPTTVPEAPNDANIYGRHALGWQSLTTQANMVTTAAPAVSASTTYVMMGLGLVITPLDGTRMVLSVDGDISNSVNNGETDIQLYYGTGAAPANGVAVTGTAVGSPIRYEASTGGSLGPFSKTVLVTGLTKGTAYWFDLGLKVITGIGSISNVDFTGFGIL
jgi:hypothetical protein